CTDSRISFAWASRDTVSCRLIRLGAPSVRGQTLPCTTVHCREGRGRECPSKTGESGRRTGRTCTCPARLTEEMGGRSIVHEGTREALLF
ncbi:unnamed protein product, partial [Ectocarpus sp. 12 AP-2014]